jgi:hypothetical protein
VAEKESAAIVYLCCADAKEFDDLLWSLKFLDLNFNNHFQYPVGSKSAQPSIRITEHWFPLEVRHENRTNPKPQCLTSLKPPKVLIFHENFGDGQKNQIMAITRSPIEFHKVEFRVPTFLDPNYVPR